MGDHREYSDRLRCQWDGEAGGWNDFLRRVRLAFEKTSRRKRHLLGPEVVGQLTGKAWVVTQELDHRRLVRRDGVIYLLEFLREKLCKTPIPDVGLRLEQLMLRLRRNPGVSMSTWGAQLRHSYRQLQIALARARRDQPARTSASSLSTPSKPRSSRRQSRETEDEPHGEAVTAMEEAEETETVLDAPSDDERPPAVRDPVTSPRHPASPPRRRDRRDSDSDSSAKALEDLELWDKYEEKLEEVLPSELLGWLLLRRAGLSAQGRLSVQAAAGNSLRLEKIETAMRGMEEELLSHEAPRGQGPGHRRRTYWVEELGQWSLLLADDEDMSEVMDNVGIRPVGPESSVHLTLQEDFGYPESWEANDEFDSTYWGGDGDYDDWDDDPAAYLTSEELQQVEEAYQVADNKLRSFVDARKAVKARHLSRGFYPFAPNSKGFRKGKGKGKGKNGFSKGKLGKGSSSSSSAATSLSMPILMNESSAYAIAPGQPGYSGCFICGERGHQFRDCPKRSSKGNPKGSRPAMFVGAADLFMVQDVHHYENVGTSSSSVTPLQEGFLPKLEEMVLAQDAVDDLSLDGFAVLDSGATETVGSLPALESLMCARFAVSGRSEKVIVTDTPPKRFKFGNGEHNFSSSHILLPLTLGEYEIPMGVFTLDVQGVPLLIGIKTLRRLQAVLDCHHDVLVLGAVDPSRGVKLRRSPSGHLLLDLRQDLLIQSFSLTQPRGGLSSPGKSEAALYSATTGKVFMIESPDASRMSSQPLVPAPSSPAVCDLPGVTTGSVMHSYRAHGNPPSHVEFGPETSSSDSMPSCKIILSLLALHGCCADFVSGGRNDGCDSACGELQFAGTGGSASSQNNTQAKGQEGEWLQGSTSRLAPLGGGRCEGSSLQRPSLPWSSRGSRFLSRQPVGLEPVRAMGRVQDLSPASELHPESRMPRASSSCWSFALRRGSCCEARASKPRDPQGQGHWLGRGREERSREPGSHSSYTSQPAGGGPRSKPQEHQCGIHSGASFDNNKDCSQDQGFRPCDEFRHLVSNLSSHGGDRRAGGKCDECYPWKEGYQTSGVSSRGPGVHAKDGMNPDSCEEKGKGHSLELQAQDLHDSFSGVCATSTSSQSQVHSVELQAQDLHDSFSGVCATATSSQSQVHSVELQAQDLLRRQDFSIPSMERLLLGLSSLSTFRGRSGQHAARKDAFRMTLGLYAHGHFAGVTNMTFKWPYLCKYLNNWLRQRAPKDAQWSTLNILYNIESKPHRDIHNLKGRSNYLITFGDHQQGELWVEGSAPEGQIADLRRRQNPHGSLVSGHLLQPHHQVVEFLPERWHATMPWTGTRIALAAYTARSLRGLDVDIRHLLRTHHFPLGTAESYNVEENEVPEEPDMSASYLTQDEKEDILTVYEDLEILLAEDFLEGHLPQEAWATEICCSKVSELSSNLSRAGKEVQTLLAADGYDLGTTKGFEAIQHHLAQNRTPWLICHVPKGPVRQGLEDRMDTGSWRKFQKVIRHLLEISRVHALCAGKVLWCEPPECSLRHLPFARSFWLAHQNYLNGKAVHCGGWTFHSNDGELLRGLPHTRSTDTSFPQVVSKLLVQDSVHVAWDGLLGAVDTSCLEKLDAKELAEIMDKVLKIHGRLGHPSNRLLVKNLQARGADPKLVAAASQLKCDVCKESKIKAPRPPVDLDRADRLWTDLQIDIFHQKIGTRNYHFLLMVDECSGYAVIRLVFDQPLEAGGNVTSEQICSLLEEAWVQYFGLPEKLKLDAEGALRGTLVTDWCAQRGVELLYAPAEHHEFISEAERTIGTLRRKIETFLRAQASDPKRAALAMVCAHNSLARTHGFSPLQWALGRDMTASGHLREGPGETPALGSLGVPGSEIRANHDLRLQASQAFLEYRHKDLAMRASNSRTQAYEHFLPGDLVYYRRYKTPADLPANQLTDHPRMTVARWFGPGRVLATETKGEAGEKRPSTHVWIISQGRLKKCHFSQLRHASESERLIASSSAGVVFPWTLTSLTSLLTKGAYDDLTSGRGRFPDSEALETGVLPEPLPDLPPGDPSVLPGHGLAPGGHDHLEDEEDPELLPERTSSPRGEKRPAPPFDEDEELVKDDGESLDLDRLLNEPSYFPLAPIPEAAAPTSSSEDFRRQRSQHELDERPLHVRGRGDVLFAETPEENKVYAVTLDAPADAKAWRQMVKDPSKFVTKSIGKGVEVSWHRLSREQQSAMAEAKSAEVSQWLQMKVCKRVAELIPASQLLRMRWVLTFKEAPPTPEGRPQVKAKARIVILGFSDPGLLEDATASPTMTRLTRQLLLNFAMMKQWSLYSADVRAAFLQARPQDRGRRLLAKPLKELAEAMGLDEQAAVELTGSAYGLSTAPREWFIDVSATLRKLGARQSRSDPCLWLVPDEAGETIGLLSSHVDDFLVCGSHHSKAWQTFVSDFKRSYSWSPWQHTNFEHCGVRVVQHEDYSVTLDHSAYCEGLTQMEPPSSGQEKMSPAQMSQAKAILGSAQWRVTQTGPQHAAKLGYLQTLLASGDVACVEQINKLVREIRACRNIGVQVANLGTMDTKQAVFVAWSDASLANRIDGSSTGGFLVGIMHPMAVLNGFGKVNAVAWRSFKLPRVARSSLSAEAQALSLCEQELMFARLAWWEMNGGEVDVRKPHEASQQVPGHLFIDARGVFDALEKADPGMAAFNVKDKYTSLELMGISENLLAQKTILSWCDSDHQLADGLTKASKQDVLKKFFLTGTWRLRHPGAFMSAKKRRALEASLRTASAEPE